MNEDEAAFVDEGGGGGLNGGGGQTKKKKMLLLEQAKFQHGETMKVTNVSRGGEEMKNKKPTVSFQQQQQQRSVFHMKKDGHKMTTTTTAPPISNPIIWKHSTTCPLCQKGHQGCITLDETRGSPRNQGNGSTDSQIGRTG